MPVLVGWSAPSQTNLRSRKFSSGLAADLTMRSVSWYRRKYSSYFLRLVCFSSARVISGDGVAFSPDGASHDPTSPDDASHDPSSGGASAPARVPSSDGFATGSAPGACHIPSLSSPAAAGPPGASSLSARSAAMRCGGRCGCRSGEGTGRRVSRSSFGAIANNSCWERDRGAAKGREFDGRAPWRTVGVAGAVRTRRSRGSGRTAPPARDTHTP